jgi:hypothetical protein
MNMTEKISQLKTIIETGMRVTDLERTIMTLCSSAVLSSGRCQLNLEIVRQMHEYCLEQLGNKEIGPVTEAKIRAISKILEQNLQLEF